jgi:hypothetical protein
MMDEKDENNVWERTKVGEVGGEKRRKRKVCAFVCCTFSHFVMFKHILEPNNIKLDVFKILC